MLCHGIQEHRQVAPDHLWLVVGVAQALSSALEAGGLGRGFCTY